MRFTLTQKKFPRTYKYLSKQNSLDVDTFIHRYNLDGLRALGPKGKPVIARKNIVDRHQDSKVMSAILVFEKYLGITEDPHYTNINYRKDSVLADKILCHSLTTYCNGCFGLGPRERQYMDFDRWLSDSLKNKDLTCIKVSDNKVVAYLIGRNKKAYYYTNSQLQDLVDAYMSHDTKAIKKLVNTHTVHKLASDGHNFAAYVVPSLPTLASRGSLSVFRKAIDRRLLLAFLSKQLHF